MPVKTWKGRGNLQHWFGLLISPLAVSMLAGAIIVFATAEKFPDWFWKLSLLVGAGWIIFYITAYTAYFQRPILMINKRLRKRRFAKPYVLVLNGNIDEARPGKVSPMYANRRPDDWCYELKKQNPVWRIELASINRAFEECPDILVNPFGEVYPEEDLSSHTTFRRIRDYVWGGGVYINVAGYPFWWKANPVTETQTPAGNFAQSPPGSSNYIIQSLLPDYLGISPSMAGAPQLLPTKQEPVDKERFGEIAGAGGKNDVTVFRHYDISTPRMVPMLRTADWKSIIIGAVPYGDGHFVFAGVEVDQTSTAFEKVLAAVQGWAKYEHEKSR